MDNGYAGIQGRSASEIEFLEVRLLAGVLVGGEEFGLSPLELAHDLVDVDALHEEFGDIPALDVLEGEVSSVVVGASHHHAFVGQAGKFLMGFVLGEVELNTLDLLEVVLGEVGQHHVPAGFVICIERRLPSSLQIYSYKDMLMADK